MTRKMFQSILCIMLCTLLAAQQSVAQSGSVGLTKDAAVRAQVLNFGVGQWVSVREQSGVKLNGTITGIGPNEFQMERRDAVGPTYVYYADVASVKRAHRRLVQFGKSSDKAWVASVGIAAVLALVLVCGDSGCR